MYIVVHVSFSSQKRDNTIFLLWKKNWSFDATPSIPSYFKIHVRLVAIHSSSFAMRGQQEQKKGSKSSLCPFADLLHGTTRYATRATNYCELNIHKGAEKM